MVSAFRVRCIQPLSHSVDATPISNYGDQSQPFEAFGIARDLFPDRRGPRGHSVAGHLNELRAKVWPRCRERHDVHSPGYYLPMAVKVERNHLHRMEEC
jgi:hypothetical protein